MKNILVPTDFSENAENALRFAINIANHFESQIYLINVYNPQSQTGMFMSVRDFMKNDSEVQLSKLVKKYKGGLFHDTNLEAKAIEGLPVDVITQLAKKLSADLIVMGTQGASGLKEIFFGSNTEAVIQKAKCPVMAIPNKYQYHPFRRIVFAVDSLDISAALILEPLSQLAQSYKAKVEVLHFAAEAVVVGIDPSIDIYLQDVERSFHQYTNISNVSASIDEFAKQCHADLLCMIRRKRSFFNRIFHASTTRQEVFHSEIPLLILHDDA